MKVKIKKLLVKSHSYVHVSCYLSQVKKSRAHNETPS